MRCCSILLGLHPHPAQQRVWSASAKNDSTTFSQEPCLGVKTNSNAVRHRRQVRPRFLRDMCRMVVEHAGCVPRPDRPRPTAAGRPRTPGSGAAPPQPGERDRSSDPVPPSASASRAAGTHNRAPCRNACPARAAGRVPPRQSPGCPASRRRRLKTVNGPSGGIFPPAGQLNQFVQHQHLGHLRVEFRIAFLQVILDPVRPQLVTRQDLPHRAACQLRQTRVTRLLAMRANMTRQ